jgi:hypothetical protein
MKTLFASLNLWWALGASAQQWYVQTNIGVDSITTNLPWSLVLSNRTLINYPDFTNFAPFGWCKITEYQQPASNYTATSWTFSNSGPASVGIYIDGQYNNNSNIIAQWTPSFMSNVLTYVNMLTPWVGSNYSQAVTTPATSSAWVAEQMRTNSANFTVSNAVQVIVAINIAGDIVRARGNSGGTTATFPWWLWWRVMTNGYPLP